MSAATAVVAGAAGSARRALSVSEKVSLSAKESVRRDGVGASSSKDAVDDAHMSYAAHAATRAPASALATSARTRRRRPLPRRARATGRIFPARRGVRGGRGAARASFVTETWRPPAPVPIETCFRASRTTACELFGAG